VRAVYAYVSSQVRYIGVAFGVGRFQPHEAADVLHNQYGDCKDKATLLSSMLEVLGLNPDSVLIGADIRMNEAVPSPASFNHLINRVKVGNEEVWLDSTQEVAPYRVLLFPLRDKQALVIPDSGPAQLLRTPKDLPFPSLETWSSVGSLNSDGVSESHIKLTLRGDDEIVLRSVVHEIAPAQYDEFGQRMMNGMGYSGTTSHASFSRPEDTSAPFTFDVDYHREKAGDWDNLKTIPQVAPIQLPTVDEKDPPTQSLNLGTPRTEASTSEMKLPQGWTAELPEAVHEKTPFASYDMTYRFENGTVYADRTLVILKQRVPAADWREYKKWTDAIGLGYDKYIQLYGKGGTAAAGGAEGHVTNPEAETLISQAYDAENKSHDSKTAEALLKRARDLDPQAKGLWSASGWVARQKGKLNEAVQDYRKELGLYPREFEVYNYLNSAYISNRDRPGAEQACREWIAANPKDARPEQYLAFDLLEDNKPAESEEEAKKAVALTPNDDVTDKELRTVVLGRAQLKAQQTSQGEATLLGILKTTIDPGTLNDAAYELANLNLDLPLAEKDIHEALTKLEEESESWTLDEAPDKLAKKSRLLIATWDSYGWVLFREGKVADAQTWVEAAWTNSQSAEEKEHVETIRTALHQSPMDEGKKAGRTARTIQLRSFSGGKATGEYRLLLQHGKVLRATATGKAVDGADELLKQASFARLFPAGSDAKLVRTGMLNCFSGKCELVLEP
jgi:tetratricopeptide (TPR) repeat protein